MVPCNLDLYFQPLSGIAAKQQLHGVALRGAQVRRRRHHGRRTDRRLRHGAVHVEARRPVSRVAKCLPGGANVKILVSAPHLAATMPPRPPNAEGRNTFLSGEQDFATFKLSDDPSTSIFWGRTLEEVYHKKMGTVKPEEPVSDKVSAVGLRTTGSPISKLNVPA